MNTTQMEIQKTSKALAILLKIFRIALFIAVGFELAGLIWLVVMGDTASTTIWGINVYPPFEAGLASVKLMEAQFAAGIVSKGIIIAMLFPAGAIFKDISLNYTPFSERHTKRLKLISILMVAFSIIPAPVEMLFTQLLAPGVESAASIEFLGIIFALIFYCLAQIFDYGRMLQQQSDETL